MNKFVRILSVFCFGMITVYARADQKKIDSVFGFDINKLDGTDVIKILKEKGIHWTRAHAEENEGVEVDEKNPQRIITTYFIGHLLDNNQALGVAYEFPPFGSSGNEIEIEFKSGYRDTLLKQLTKLYGNPVLKNTYNDQAKYKGHQMYYWKTNDPEKYLFSEIFLEMSESPSFFKSRGKKDDVLMLEGQPSARGPAQ